MVALSLLSINVERILVREVVEERRRRCGDITLDAGQVGYIRPAGLALWSRRLHVLYLAPVRM